MLKRNFLIMTLMLVFGAFLVAFSNAKPERKAVYEYVTITQTDLGFLKITEQGKEPVEEFPKKDKRNLNGAYEIINKYEELGYELFSSNAFMTNNSTHVHNFLLRREKQ